MGTRKTDSEKLQELENKIKQLDAQKKQLEARAKDRERKERTRRLIQIGAIIESLGIDSPEIAETFKRYMQDNQKTSDWLEKFIAENKTSRTSDITKI